MNTTNVKNTEGTDKKQWLQKLATGDALNYLSIDLVDQFFKEKKDEKTCPSEKCAMFHRFLRCYDHRLNIPLDASCRAENVFVVLLMDTDQKPDMRMPAYYSEALCASHEMEKTLLVYITEHSCLEDRWYQKVKTYITSPADEKNNEEEIREWLPTWPNFMIIDLENFQKEVTAPGGFLEQFLKILAESRTLEEARKVLDTVVEKQYKFGLDEIAKEKNRADRLEAENKVMAEKIAEMEALLARS